MDNGINTEAVRELGKDLFFNSGDDKDSRSQGLKLLLFSADNGDAEASFIIGRLILDKVIFPKKSDPAECALTAILSAADKGYAPARTFINLYCQEKYVRDVSDKIIRKTDSGRLVDFDGKPIKIDRTGLFTPIDASLYHENGINVFELKFSVSFMADDELENADKFRKAVLDGFSLWQGRYEVFGGQPVEVRVCIEPDERIFDCVTVAPMTEAMINQTQKLAEKLNIRKGVSQAEKIISEKRSFAISGIRWSATSRKIIYIMCKDCKFDDYEEIKHVAKHEFGHALGLGDLYESESDNLSGVEKGSFAELDSYYIANNVYNLVMCDHHGPISNNDIEMIILAFRENKVQNYQMQLSKKISEALGKGN